MIEQPPEKMDENHLEQPIGQHPLPTTHVVDLGEQQVESGRQDVDLAQRERDHLREGAYQWMVLSAVEIESCASKVRVLGGRIVERMIQRTWVEQQRGLGDLVFLQARTAGLVGHGHLTVAKDVKEPPTRLSSKGRHPA